MAQCKNMWGNLSLDAKERFSHTPSEKAIKELINADLPYSNV